MARRRFCHAQCQTIRIRILGRRCPLDRILWRRPLFQMLCRLCLVRIHIASPPRLLVVPERFSLHCRQRRTDLPSRWLTWCWPTRLLRHWQERHLARLALLLGPLGRQHLMGLPARLIRFWGMLRGWRRLGDEPEQR